MKHHDLGWKIIKILNYDPAFAMPRLYHSLHIRDELAKSIGCTYILKGSEMLLRYIARRKTTIDRPLFSEIFGIELPESLAPALYLNYTTGVPNEVYRTAMAAEIAEILTPWAREIVDVKIPFREITEEALMTLFNPGGHPDEPVLRYDLSLFLTKVDLLIWHGGYLAESELFDLPLVDLNPLPKIPVASGIDRERLVDVMLDHPLTIEMLREIMELISSS